MNNIFKYSPKELTTDAFLNYLFIWLNDNNCLEIAKDILTKPKDRNKSTANIKVERQVSFGKEKADLVVNFLLNEEYKSVLFENKTNTTTSKKQLMSYKKGEEKYKYNYLKLGYIDKKERKICQDCGYDIIDVNLLYNILLKINNPDLIIEQYKNYILNYYVNPLKEIIEKYKDGSIANKLCDQRAQLYLADKLSDNFGIFEYNANNLPANENKYRIQYRSNIGGNPWTQIVLIENESKYPDSIFWRIDKRSGKYYIRLNMYSKSQNIDNKERTERLKNLRDFSLKFFNKYPYLKQGKLSNRRGREREIVIFFFDENPLHKLLRKIREFTFEFKKFYHSKYYNH
ncbi:MAG: hypothetical protein ACOX0V_09095 [Bacteroidales bacterium]|jgi:hypothetical protein|nr:hypothetical protein [Bacteroidales bacterium]MCK9499845.1 hypothetical protein [Bacteroidales bacterium]